jgi:hypothetical protein
MHALGLQPAMVSAAREVTAAMGNLDWQPAAGPWTAEGVLEALHAGGALRSRSLDNKGG